MAKQRAVSTGSYGLKEEIHYLYYASYVPSGVPQKLRILSQNVEYKSAEKILSYPYNRLSKCGDRIIDRRSRRRAGVGCPTPSPAALRALALDSSWYEEPSARKNGRSMQTPRDNGSLFFVPKLREPLHGINPTKVSPRC